MGELHYGPGRTRVRIDDRTLAHLMVVTTSKLRRDEPFLLSWTNGNEVGNGRSALWIHRNCDLHYRFDGGRMPALDQSLLEHMSVAASSAGGLQLEDATLAPR